MKMADISQYTEKIRKAVYGEEVRGSIINALEAVNDDNNSYQAIKDEIKQDKQDIDNTVEEFDGLVEQVTEAKEVIVSSLESVETAKRDLQAVVADAENKNSTLVSSISGAYNANAALQTVTRNAETATTNAETAKTNLDASIGTSETKKADLDGVVSQANTAEWNLQQQISNAQRAGSNLGIQMSSANSVKAELQSATSDAENMKSDLSDVLATATEKHTALTETVQTAEQLDSHITNENDRAENNINALDVRLENADEILTGVEDIKAYLGYDDEHIVGLQADFRNKTFKRLAGAYGLNAGTDFDAFPMFGGRRRCNVAADGTINAYYGDEGYTEDGTNGQVMVYQPAFYYKVVPLELEKNTVSGIGNHLRKANYYVSSKPVFGFKRHPLFYDEQGNPVDYVLLSAYEGSMYDVSEEAYVNDSVDTSVSYGAGDLLCSVAGKKPISGRLNGVGNKTQFETMANNIGSGWHLNTIKAESANQLLMLIELGRFNTQAAIGQGVVSCPNNGSYNCSSYTGSTASLGNATGMATETTYESAGTETVNTTNGKLSVTYRGVENPWGNIWKHTNGINLWGDGHMGGGQVFICDDFSFNESKHDGNYQSAGFTVSNGDGYVSAFGYGDEDYDWLFMPSETTGNSSLPVGDYFYRTSNMNGYRIALLGGSWNYGDNAGGFSWTCYAAPSYRNYAVGGRLLYVPSGAE